MSAVIDVESAAELIGLTNTAAFGKWRDDRNVLLTKQNALVCNHAKTFLLRSMEKT
jgi:hypothetical protein